MLHVALVFRSTLLFRSSWFLHTCRAVLPHASWQHPFWTTTCIRLRQNHSSLLELPKQALAVLRSGRRWLHLAGRVPRFFSSALDTRSHLGLSHALSLTVRTFPLPSLLQWCLVIWILLDREVLRTECWWTPRAIYILLTLVGIQPALCCTFVSPPTTVQALRGLLQQTLSSLQCHPQICVTWQQTDCQFWRLPL